jgi:uncharacterized glyoxalase superfamily protein PhnB
MPDRPALFAYLSYNDAPAGIAWLTALGFDVVSRVDDGDGGVQHCEVRLGDVVLMLATSDAPYEQPPLRGRSTGRGLYLRTSEVDTLFDRAVAAGAREVFAPEDTEWGTRRARVLDFEGNEWSFGSYEPGQSWS